MSPDAVITVTESCEEVKASDVEYGLAGLKADQRGSHDYCLGGFLQPHWQLFTWQRHAFFWHAQEQASQSQLPQQLDLVTDFEMVFVKSDIVGLPYVRF